MLVFGSRFMRLPVSVLIACVATVSLAASDESADRRANLPSLPGAVYKPPAWIDGSEPFDVETFFASPPVEKNAAFAYLDALFEFEPRLDVCFKAASDMERRRKVIEERTSRLVKSFKSLQADSRSVRVEKIDRLVVEFEPGFGKLAAAQRRNPCVFESGVGWDSPLPHAQAARNVTRAGQMRAERALDRGDIERAIDGFAITLRLSRDLRRRGYGLCQVVTFAINRVLLEDLLCQILVAPRLTRKRCDRLLALLEEHERSTVDPLSEAVRTDYVAWRQFLHDLYVPWKRARGNKNPAEQDIQGMLLRLPEGYGIDTENAPALADRFHKVFEDNCRTEVHALDRTVTAILSPRRRSYPRQSMVRREALRNLYCSLLFGFMDKHQFTPFSDLMLRKCAWDRVLIDGSRCLVALRRWQLTRPDEAPTDLEQVVRAAGMARVPIDVFSGKPFKMNVIDGEPVIYSVGSDGKDDHGAVDWNFDAEPGDVLFRVALSRRRLLPPPRVVQPRSRSSKSPRRTRVRRSRRRR